MVETSWFAPDREVFADAANGEDRGAGDRLAMTVSFGSGPYFGPDPRTHEQNQARGRTNPVQGARADEVAFTFKLTTCGSPRSRIAKAGRLPAGVTFTSHNDGTATISGTPRRAVAGMYPLTLTARNKYGTATQTFTLTVTRAPAVR